MGAEERNLGIGILGGNDGSRGMGYLEDFGALLIVTWA